MPADDPKVNACAETLVRAYRQHAPVAALPADGPDDLTQACAVQRAVWRAMVDTARPMAWKVGAPSRDTTPLAAPVFPERVLSARTILPSGMFLRVGIEAEIAFRFGHDLPARERPYAIGEIRDAIDAAHVAMELVDTRLADPEAAGPLWRLADNLLNGALVIGDAIPDWRAIDFSSLTVRVMAGGATLAETLGQPPLDDLFHCLPWWIDHAGGARAGDIVTTGAWNGMHPIPMPNVAGVEFLGLGEALVSLI